MAPRVLQHLLDDLDALPSPVFGKNGSAISVVRMNSPISDAQRSSADTEKTLSWRPRSRCRSFPFGKPMSNPTSTQSTTAPPLIGRGCPVPSIERCARCGNFARWSSMSGERAWSRWRLWYRRYGECRRRTATASTLDTTRSHRLHRGSCWIVRVAVRLSRHRRIETRMNLVADLSRARRME